ncbi:MAG: branched-chain amino acid ABC transporter substrate-binding protein [Anaerolineales bacterium]|nr:branched-chain amino acid ABC transporter substrate-binding protein [Anaerolineales bacterium]
MKRLTTLMVMLMVASMLISACAPAAPTEEPAAPTEVPAVEPTEAPPEPPDEPAEAGIYLGMTAEELMAAGYVVIAPGETIRIGQSTGLTGPIPDPGLDIAQAAELAVDDLNAAGGFEGHDFELVTEDGACDGDAATIVGNKFAADPSIVAIQGGMCTGETLALVPILSAARIPFVSASSTNPAVTSEECDVCNRVALSDKLQADVDADYIYNVLGVRTIALMHDNSDYGLGLAELMQDSFNAEGGSIVDFQGVQVGDTDFRAVLTLIAASQPELIFFGGYSTEAGLITIQMDEVGLGDAIFFSDDGTYTAQYLDTADVAAEGAYASFVSGDEVAEANAAFDAKYLEKYGVAPDDLGPFHGQAYDAVNMIAEAIMSVAVTDDAGEGYLIIEREAVVTAVRSTKGLQGLMGYMVCSAIGDCGAGGIQIFQVQEGAWVQVSGFGLE